MVAWIGAWTTFTPTPTPAAAAGTSAPELSTAPTTVPLSTTTSTPTHPPAALSSLPYAEQLVAVLTQMALSHA